MKEEKKNKREWMQEEDMESKKPNRKVERTYNEEEEEIDEDSSEGSEMEEDEDEMNDEPEEKNENLKEKEEQSPKELSQDEKQNLIQNQIIALRDTGVFHFQILNILQAQLELQSNQIKLLEEQSRYLKGIGNNLIEVGKILDEKLGEN